MQVDKKYLNGYINSDDEANLLAPGEILTASNMRFGHSGRWESIGITAVIDNPLLPEGQNICIGSVSNEADRYLISFIFNSEGNHGIHLFHNGTWYTVFQDPVLNFAHNRLIRALAVNDTLYFTDDYNPPRCIHLPSAIDFASNGSTPLLPKYSLTQALSATDILLIRKPFGLPPYTRKEQDTAYGLNRIANESFQFAVQYIYWTGEKSVLSPWSVASKLNSEEENYNFITVALPVSETIPQEVRFVRLLALFGSTKKAFVVKTWDRANGTEKAVLAAHNGGTQRIEYSFFNTTTGEALSDAETVQPFHSVPLLAKAMEAARNRLFLANNLEGYDTPVSTSLAVSTPATGERNNVYGLHMITAQYTNGDTGDVHYIGGYAIYATINGRTCYYFLNDTREENINNQVAVGAPPTTADFEDLTELGVGESITWNLKPSGNYSFTSQAVVTTTGSSVTLMNLEDEENSYAAYFKGGGVYQWGVVFYDEALRKCGVVTNEGLKVSIRDRDYALTYATPTMQWEVTNDDATGQIPSWAKYYAPVRTLNLKTRFFLQGYTEGVFYAFQDDKEGYVMKKEPFSDEVVGIGISCKYIQRAGIAYTFTEGDICMLHFPGQTKAVEIPVIDKVGNFIVLKSRDIGNPSGMKAVVEIYTPYTPSENEPFYEVGVMHPVLNPGTDNRAFSVLSGTMPGDVYILSRKLNALGGTYSAEAMCPNDKYWQRWDTDAGRANLVTTLGQYRDKTGLRYSENFIYGTQQNGLSAFDALNQEDLPVELGALQSLVLTSKAQSEGTVMLAIGTTETASLYLGETQVSNTDGSTYFIKDVGVVGQINILRGSYGTLHPESIISYKGGVWWFDVRSAAFVQYSANGLFPISSYKVSRFTKLLSQALQPGSTIFGGVDPFHEELLWTIPHLGDNPRTLDDYNEPRPYPYDLWDKGAKTLVYKLQAGRWMGQFSEIPENWINLGSDLYSAKEGILRKHNQPGDVTSRIAFVCNAQNAVKVFLSLALEASEAPAWVHLRSEDPYTAANEIIDSEFTMKEGVWYAPIQRDRLSPNAKGNFDMKQLTGDPMRSKALLFVLEWNAACWFRMAAMGFNLSSGHY